MVKILVRDYDKMVAHAKNELPNEACGLIGGVREGTNKIIKEVYLLKNQDASNEHFSIDPKEHLAVIKDMRTKGMVPLGNWHSHPETPARMSEEDKRLAYDSNACYMILSLMDAEHPVLHAFRMAEGESLKEDLLIISEL